MIELYLVCVHVPSLPLMHWPVTAYRLAWRTAFCNVSFVKNRYPKSMVAIANTSRSDNEIAVSANA
jgi:hypothetical protein